jgi:hypothetical protein
MPESSPSLGGESNSAPDTIAALLRKLMGGFVGPSTAEGSGGGDYFYAIDDSMDNIRRNGLAHYGIPPEHQAKVARELGLDRED